MRPIKFRGKSIETGKWVEGYLFCSWDKAFILWGTTAGIPNMVEVDPATVGQYTGLKDKKGAMIFEGDILSDGAFTYEVRYEGTGFVMILDGQAYTMDTRPTKIVIGNIHDNPELLK